MPKQVKNCKWVGRVGLPVQDLTKQDGKTVITAAHREL